MSSIVVVQVGQCGNQLGECLWRQLARSSSKAASSPFFTQEGFARCVMVDAEPKVVQGILNRNPSLFRADCAALGQSGRGSNWALGYNGINASYSRHSEQHATQKAFVVNKEQRSDDSKLLATALSAIHRESTRTASSSFEAIVFIHSLAGGTGSGVASRLAEKIHQYFIEAPDERCPDGFFYHNPRGRNRERRLQDEKELERDGLAGLYGERRRAMYLVSIAVSPQQCGETSTQSINTVLTLNALRPIADAVLLLRNDDALCLAKLMRESAGGMPTSPRGESRGGGTIRWGPAASVPSPTFHEMNLFLVDMLLPVLHYGREVGVIGELIAKCCPIKGFKMLTLVPIPQKQYTRFQQSTILSRLYEVAHISIGSYPPGDVAQLLAEIPLETMHTPKTAQILEFASTHVRVSPMQGSVYSPPKKLLGVLVLNQVRELNKEVLFPLVLDCSLKVSQNAFMHLYDDAGVSVDRIRRAYKSVAEMLCYSGASDTVSSAAEE